MQFNVIHYIFKYTTGEHMGKWVGYSDAAFYAIHPNNPSTSEFLVKYDLESAREIANRYNFSIFPLIIYLPNSSEEIY